MTIYKATFKAYDYWYTCDNDGWRTIEKFFTTREKAEAWMAEVKDYVFRGQHNEHIATKETEKPRGWTIEEIEVE